MLVLAALVLVLIAAASIQDRLWWDGWAIWSLKGRVLLLEGTLPPAFLDPDGGYAFTHLDYPLALPLMYWWMWSHSGVAAAATASFAGAAWFAVLTLLLWSALRSRVDARTAALATLGHALFWPIALYATGGTADIVIAVALLGAVVELERILTRDDSGALVRFTVFLTLGVLAKNEGLAIAVVALTVAAVALLLRRERRWRMLALIVPLVAAAPWWLFIASLDVRQPVVVSTAASAIADRIPVLLARIGGLLASVPWLPVPMLGAVGAIAAARDRSPGVTAGWLVLAMYFGVVAAVYILTPHDIEWLLSTSLPRVLSVFVPPVLFLSLVAAAPRGAAQVAA